MNDFEGQNLKKIGVRNELCPNGSNKRGYHSS